MQDADTPIWRPADARVAGSTMAAFMRRAAGRAGRALRTYEELHAWSVSDVAGFWREVWDLAGIRASDPPAAVVDDPRRMPGARWFPGARLNFAENLLRRRDDHPAIVFRDERRARRQALTFRELHDEVARVAAWLRDAGVGAGDRVAGYMPNVPQTVIAMLAAASLGAVWSSCSPDFGVRGVLDRFARIEPRVLFCADATAYGGRVFQSLERVRGVLAALPRAPRVVVAGYIDPRPDLGGLPGAVRFEELCPGAVPTMRLFQGAFDHPLYIMYSSGTTGPPKCIVQPAGGVLLNQLKEHLLHVDLRPDDVIFYYTTCGWMMWNWLVAALGVGATIVLYEGSPFHPDPMALWHMAAEEGITVLGCSASYLAALEKSGTRPGDYLPLPRLRTILSTGSPLAEQSFDYVYRHVKPDVQLASISGGTDLNGCFVGGCPLLPVYRGEIQCRCLGMDVHAWDEEGRDLVGEPGELVCTQAFPSMPVGFHGDPEGSAYRAAYFERFPGVWTHGDFITINRRGGIRISGRSDATLNPGGVRIGTAEIYRQVEGMPEIADSIAVAQRWEGDVRVVLFVKLAGGARLDDDLRERIRRAIRADCSPRHVPARIVAVPDIPYTHSGKKVELAVRSIVNGEPVRNREALRNPGALEAFTNLPELRS